ncbi:abortive infection family protein [Muricoccus pecuniae]|uniref:Abortive infection protein-like C-terminal domain-containing protein n=1 Tax=Muricoccus pecuniae TaxID=693023 RepID=A0A840YLK4_9PROT|nr:abortive infection family protein [Roseomonas pecuniae]MBB5696012.1 hypothetical protein [Roseomonas pecuniae]
MSLPPWGAGDEESLIDKVTRLQNGLVARATGGNFDDDEYKQLRDELTRNPMTAGKLPAFVRPCRDTSQFWPYIQIEHAQYQGRRVHIWDAFRPLLDQLEAQENSPGTEPITEALEVLDAEHVAVAWTKALERRTDDPDGAITAARTMLETVCKHILDDAEKAYPDDVDLPRLWGMTAELLNLAPNQHQEPVFKAILGNAQAVVGNLAAIRNKAGDAHGQGRTGIRAQPRHAELAVNLAGTMASFLVSTWQHRSKKTADWFS